MPPRTEVPAFDRLHAAILSGLTVLALFGVSAQPASSQDVPTEMPTRLAVFLDCQGCDETFIRQELTYRGVDRVLRGGVQRDRRVDPVVFTEWQFCVAAVDGT